MILLFFWQKRLQRNSEKRKWNSSFAVWREGGPCKILRNMFFNDSTAFFLRIKLNENINLWLYKVVFLSRNVFTKENGLQKLNRSTQIQTTLECLHFIEGMFTHYGAIIDGIIYDIWLVEITQYAYIYGCHVPCFTQALLSPTFQVSGQMWKGKG